MAAICNPADQPSVRFTRASTWPELSGWPEMPVTRLAASGVEKARSAWRTSVTSRRRRRAWRGSRRSVRHPMRRWMFGGHCSASTPMSAYSAALPSASTLSSTSATSPRPSRVPSRSASARSPSPGPTTWVASPGAAPTASMAARRQVAKRTGSSSRSSMVSQATEPAGCPAAHWASSTDLPKPAGATTRERWPEPLRSRRRVRRGRSTAKPGTDGGLIFAASKESTQRPCAGLPQLGRRAHRQP